jgi:hypothetical protein
MSFPRALGVYLHTLVRDLWYADSGPSPERIRGSAGIRVKGRAAPAVGSRAKQPKSLIAALGLVLALSGCSGSLFLDQDVTDYRFTSGKAGNDQLLLNILRARDNAPIHFSELSMIRGSVQMTAGAGATIPFGHGPLARNIFSPSVGWQTTPTFDLGTLDTQDFTKGIIGPIDLNAIKVFFNQGIDPRIALILFFSEYAEKGKTYHNNLSCDPNRPDLLGEGCRYNLYDYFGKINEFVLPDRTVRQNLYRPIRANVYVELRPVGPPSPIPNGQQKDLAGIDFKKFKLLPAYMGTDKGKPVQFYQLFSMSESKLALCDEGGNRLFAGRLADPRPCKHSEVVVPPWAPLGNGTSLSLRSPYEIMKYLGQVLQFQEERRALGENRCITLDPWDDRTCDTGDVLFQVNAPVGTPVVATEYGGVSYSVAMRACEIAAPCDHSLEVLAILSVLLNINKAAKDIPSTPAVQVLR